ncbi:DUF4349 domain-containing protein [Candidatus Micrarchaeota archaeon]|nr:DUF4349 domain-containing protein [Candidatus Micrarchaeota archaeon]
MKNYSILFLVLGLLLFGCISDDSYINGYDAGYDEYGDYEEALAPSAMGSLMKESTYSEDRSDQYLIKEGSISLKVGEGQLEDSLSSLFSILEERNAEISEIGFNDYYDEKVYRLVIRISPEDFESLFEDIKNIGEIKSASTSVEDVTQEYKDLETRIANKEIELGRLQEMYEMADNVEELLMVERELSRVEVELELFKQTKEYYDNKISMSTIWISLTEEKSPVDVQLIPSLEALGAIFFGALGIGITIIVALVGFGIPIAIIALLIKFIFFHHKKR